MMTTISNQPEKLPNKKLGLILIILCSAALGLVLIGNSTKIRPDKSIQEITFQTFIIKYTNANEKVTLVAVNGIFVEGYLNKSKEDVQNDMNIAPDFYFKINSIQQFNLVLDKIQNKLGANTQISVLYDSRDTNLNMILRNFLIPLVVLVIIIGTCIFIVRYSKNTFTKKSL